MITKIIDIHTHAFPEKIAEKAVAQLQDHYGIPIAHGGTVESLLSCASEANVEALVALTAATKPYQVESAIEWALELAARDKRVIPFGTMHPDYQDIPGMMEKIAAMGLKGIKLHPDFQAFDVDDPRAYPIYEAAQRLDLIIMFHAGDPVLDYASPVRIARVLRAYPGLRAVVAHLGGYAQLGEARKHLAPIIKGNPRLYVDTSSSLWCLSPETAAEHIGAIGVDRVLFGTDYPIRSQLEEISYIDRLGLSREEKEAVLYGNASRLLGLI